MSKTLFLLCPMCLLWFSINSVLSKSLANILNHIVTLEHIEKEGKVPSCIFIDLKCSNYVGNIISIVTYVPTVVNFQLSKLRNGKI